MYTNIAQQNMFAQNQQEYNQQIFKGQKRLREEEQEHQDNMQKRRQPKTLFRPWSDEQTEKKENIIKKHEMPVIMAQQPNLAMPAAPAFHLTPYQMAVHQQQRQTALALQQALYQRQLIMAQVWAQHRQQQHHQMMIHHQQQMRQQQMFVFGQQHGHK